MSMSLAILPPLIGGLGIFLLGMKHLSEGLQATAGGGLRKFMAKATSHRIVGIGSGIVSTMIVQSSSIITVMLVGFVSTALMTLPQAFAVLIGANIGTTATIWIIAYAPDPQLLGFLGLGLGGILYFFLRVSEIRSNAALPVQRRRDAVENIVLKAAPPDLDQIPEFRPHVGVHGFEVCSG